MTTLMLFVDLRNTNNFETVPSFVWKGAEAFARDVPDARIVPVDSGHFALENCCAEIAREIRDFF